MEAQKPLQFNGTAGGYFLVWLVSLIGMYIPWFGWAFALNFASEWVADSSMVNGKKVVYRAGYGESLKFVFIQSLLLFVTFGIYTFWFVPKMYRYVTGHIQYADAAESAAAPAPEASVAAASDQPQTPPAS